MNAQKQKLLEKIHNQIKEKRKFILSQMPNVHRIDDGIIIRYFTEWDHCIDDEHIKWKKINNLDEPDESVVLFYLPKGSNFELKQRFYIGCMTCLSGKMEVFVNDKDISLESYQKICVDSEDVSGKVLENTYLITSSNRALWSKTTKEHVEEITTS